MMSDLSPGISMIIFLSGAIVLAVWIWFYLLYFNRVIAFLLSKFLYYWTFKKQKSYFRVSSISVAPLGGKILFKNLQYTTKDYSLRVFDGSMTISWWQTVKRKWKKSDHRSRIHARLSGVELLVYNNTSKYDHVRNLYHQRTNQAFNMNENIDPDTEDHKMDEAERKRHLRTHDSVQTLFAWAKSIGIDISRFNLIIGNQYLPSIVEITNKRLHGVIRLENSPSSLDKYRFVVDAELDNTITHVHRNPLVNVEDKTPEHHQQRYDIEEDSFDFVHRQFKSAFKDVVHFDFLREENLASDYDEATFVEKIKVPYSYEYPQNHEDEKRVVHDETKIFHCFRTHVNYFYDKPGIIPVEDSEDFVNVDSADYKPPEHGIQIEFGEMECNSLVYGPYADHQRSMIQSFFFPDTFEDAEIITRQYGHVRPYETFEIGLTFNKPDKPDMYTTWLLPFKRTPATLMEKKVQRGDPELISLQFGAGTTIVWSSPQGCLNPRHFLDQQQEHISESEIRRLLRRHSYETKINIDIKNPQIFTSNSGAVMGSAKLAECRFKLHNEQSWNGMRDWSFHFDFHSTRLFYLADHVQIFKDLIRDWSNYPNRRLPTLREFVPSKTEYKFCFRMADIFMHANSYNIIEHPNDMSKNIFFHIVTPILDIEFNTESVKFRPSSYDYKFDVNLQSSPSHQPYVRVHWPPDHPLGQKIGGEVQKFLTGDKLRVHGNYFIHSTIQPGKMDSLHINVDIKHADILLSGYYFNYLITMWFNYFTIQKSFMTREEFILNRYHNEKNRQFWLLNSTNSEGYPYPVNPTEYFIEVDIERGRLLIPPNMYTAVSNEMGYIMVDHFEAEIRYVPEYLAFCFNLTPLVLEMPQPKKTDTEVKTRHGNNTTFLGVERIDFWGQLSVGPPPDGNFYKMDFELDIGEITGEMHPCQIGQILSVVHNVGKQWSYAYLPDVELDQPPVYKNRIYDPYEVSKLRIIELNLKTQRICVDIIDSRGVIHTSLHQGISFEWSTHNDGQNNERMNIALPHVEIKFLTYKESHLGIRLDDEWIDVGNVDLGIRVSIKDRQPSVVDDQVMQEDFLLAHSVLQNLQFAEWEIQSNRISLEFHSSASHRKQLEQPCSLHGASNNNDARHSSINHNNGREDADRNNLLLVQPSMAAEDDNIVSFIDDDSYYETAHSDFESARSNISTSDDDSEAHDDSETLSSTSVQRNEPVKSNSTTGDMHHPVKEVNTVFHPTGKYTTRSRELLQRYADQFVSTVHLSQASRTDDGNASHYDYEDSDDDDDDDGDMDNTVFIYRNRSSIWSRNPNFNFFHRYLDSYIFEQENPTLSPLSLKFDQLYEVPFAMGMRSPFPSTQLRLLSDSSSRIPCFFRLSDQKSRDSSRVIREAHAKYLEELGNTGENIDSEIPTMLLPNEKESSKPSQKHIHLDFVRSIDAMISPSVAPLLQSLLEPILFPLNNLIDTADSVERDTVIDDDHDKRLPKGEKEVGDPIAKPSEDWLFKETIFSCSLDRITIDCIQTVRPYAVLNHSAILGKPTSTVLRLIGEHIFLSTSITFRHMAGNEHQQSPSQVDSTNSTTVNKHCLYESTILAKIKTIQISLQCLNKNKKSFPGVLTTDLDKNVTKNLIDGRPVIALISLCEFGVNAKYDCQHASETQARLTFNTRDSISIYFIEELPAILHSMMMLWKGIIDDVVQHAKRLSRMKHLYKLVLLVGLSRYDKLASTIDLHGRDSWIADEEDGSLQRRSRLMHAIRNSFNTNRERRSANVSIHQRHETLDESFIMTDFRPPPKADALIRMRQVLNSLTFEEIKNIRSMMPTWHSLDTYLEAEKFKMVGSQFTSLLRDDQNKAGDTRSIPHPHNKLTSQEMANRKRRFDISVDLPTISVSLHAVNHERSVLTKSIAQIDRISARASIKDGFIMDPRIIGTSLGRIWNADNYIHETGIMMLLELGSVSMDFHPEAVSILTCIAGIGLTVKAQDRMLSKNTIDESTIAPDDETRKQKRHTRSKTAYNLNELLDYTSPSLPRRSQRDAVALTNSSTTSARESQQKRSSQFDGSRPKMRQFHIFSTISINRVEARAWTDMCNFAELDFDSISLSFNQPRNVEEIKVQLDRSSRFNVTSKFGVDMIGAMGEHQLRLVHSSTLAIARIQLQYNFAHESGNTTVHNAAEGTEFISLFDASVGNIVISEFWFHNGDDPNMHITASFSEFDIHVPFTEIWSAASMQFRNFAAIWYKMISAKPIADPSFLGDSSSKSFHATKMREVEMGRNDAQQQQRSDIQDTHTDSQEQQQQQSNASLLFDNTPTINLVLDLQNISCHFNILPTLQMRYMLTRLSASYNQPSTKSGTLRLHLHPHTIAFKTNLDEPFPDINERWDISRHQTGSNTVLEPQRFRTQFVLPEIFISGNISTHKEMSDDRVLQMSRFVQISVSVGFVENVVTSEILTNILYLQSTMLSEINKVIEVFTSVMQTSGKELTQRIKSELPKAQASVSSLNMDLSVNLLLTGMRLMALGTSTAAVLDIGTTKLHFRNQSGSDLKHLKWKVLLESIAVEMIDIYRIKWDREQQNGKYSNLDSCYRWATFRTKIHAHNSDSNKSIALDRARSTPGQLINSSTKRFHIHIRDTHIYLRPGCIDQASFMFKDYHQAFLDLRLHLRQSMEHMNTSAIMKLMKTGEEYYTYYSKQIVEQVTKDPTLFINSGNIRIFNTTLCLPIGDNPYYGFLANHNPSFIPKSALQMLIPLIDASMLMQSGDELSPALDPLIQATVEPDATSSRQVALCRINDICLYFEETKGKGQRFIAPPTLEKFSRAPNRLKIAKSVMSMELVTNGDIIRGKGSITVSGPDLHGVPSIFTHLLHLRNDWLNPKRSLYSDPLQFTQRTSTEGSDTEVVKIPDLSSASKPSAVAAPILNSRKIHVTLMATIEPGTSKMYHTLHSRSLSSPRTPRNRGTARRLSDDSSVVIATKLPQCDLEFVHISPPKNTASSSSSSHRGSSPRKMANRSNTHVQVSVHWTGASFSPQVVFFAEEAYLLYRSFERNNKRRHKENAGNTFDDSVVLKPLQWMNLLRAVILIQKLYRGYKTRKRFKQLISGGGDNNQSTYRTSKRSISPSSDDSKDHPGKTDSQVLLRTDTFSFLCRIDPFEIQLLCTPASEIVFCMAFSKPFDLLFTRSFRSVRTGTIQGDAIYNTIYLSSPEIMFRIYQDLPLLSSKPRDCARLTIHGIKANLGIGFGHFLRPDDASVLAGTVNVERVEFDGNLPQMNEFFIMYAVFMDKREEAQQILKDFFRDDDSFMTGDYHEPGISQTRATSSVKQRSRKKTVEEMNLDATSSRFGQIFINEVKVHVDLSNIIGTQSIHVKSVLSFCVIEDVSRRVVHVTRCTLEAISEQ